MTNVWNIAVSEALKYHPLYRPWKKHFAHGPDTQQAARENIPLNMCSIILVGMSI